MRVNLAAAVGAAIAVLLAAVVHAQHPVQVVITIAASSAIAALLRSDKPNTPADCS